MQRLQQYLTSFKHKTANACTPEQYGVPLHLRGHLKSGGAQEIFPALSAGQVPPLSMVFIDRRLNSVGLLFFRLRNDLYCVGWGAKFKLYRVYSLSHSLTLDYNSAIYNHSLRNLNWRLLWQSGVKRMYVTTIPLCQPVPVLCFISWKAFKDCCYFRLYFCLECTK